MALITELNLYPIKSCGGISLREATLTAAGLMSEHIYDREWMVVDPQGNFLTQREFPRMATIVPRLKADYLELRAPGMLRLEVPLDLPPPEDERTCKVKVWNDTVQAYDCDETTAVWFSNALGTPCRLVRFHPDSRRSANKKWAGSVEAPTLFSDGYPLLVISEESLEDLNRKLADQGRSALPMNRFRPNLVVRGVTPFEEDKASVLRMGQAEIKPVKPCVRCPIPSVDQASGEIGPDPLDILAGYRGNPLVGGGITFGMNAVVLKGDGMTLRVGDEVKLDLNF